MLSVGIDSTEKKHNEDASHLHSCNDVLMARMYPMAASNGWSVAGGNQFSGRLPASTPWEQLSTYQADSVRLHRDAAFKPNVLTGILTDLDVSHNRLVQVSAHHAWLPTADWCTVFRS